MKTKNINGITELLEELQQDFNEKDIVWFRGQSKLNWKLIPSIARKQKWIDSEMTLIKRFKQNALPFSKNRPISEWEWLFLMQHHGVPTRLLDWTESPLVGLYFAVNENPRSDGALWSLQPTKLNKHANINYAFDLEVPSFDQDPILENYLPSKLASEKTSDLQPIAAMAMRDNPRIYAQLGTFTITHREQYAVEDVADKKHIKCYTIPKARKNFIKKQLAYLKFTKLTLFPELDNVAIIAKEVLK